MLRLSETTQETTPSQSLSIVQRELLLFREWIRIVTRDPRKYFSITSALYLSDLLRKTQSIRSLYFFCRQVDDFADGDQIVPWLHHDFPTLVASLHRQVDGKRSVHHSTGFLLSHAMHGRDAAVREEIAACLHSFLETSLFDYNRRIHRTVLSQKELDIHYERSFPPVHNLAFISAQSSIRSSDLAPLSLLQGKVYALRDLMHELPKGQINVPAETIVQSRISTHDFVTHPAVQTLPAVAQWVAEERQKASRLLEEVETKNKGEAGAILQVLLPPIRKFLQR